MLALSAEKTDGAHTYLVTPEHTELARQAARIGSVALRRASRALEDDPARAREIGRAHTSIYVRLPNYQSNLLRWASATRTSSTAEATGLVDAIVAWGDEQTILDRVRAHFDAGADHVCIQPIAAGPRDIPADQWRTLAPGMKDLAASDLSAFCPNRVCGPRRTPARRVPRPAASRRL